MPAEPTPKRASYSICPTSEEGQQNADRGLLNKQGTHTTHIDSSSCAKKYVKTAKHFSAVQNHDAFLCCRVHCIFFGSLLIEVYRQPAKTSIGSDGFFKNQDTRCYAVGARISNGGYQVSLSRPQCPAPALELQTLRAKLLLLTPQLPHLLIRFQIIPVVVLSISVR